MSSEKSAYVRALVSERWGAWRYWKSFHTWLYIIIGGLSSGIASFVAINSKYDIVCQKYAWIPALLAAILTFIISALGAQAEAKAFELAGRMLEAGLARYDTDLEFGDLELGKVLEAAVETLNKKT